MLTLYLIFMPQSIAERRQKMRNHIRSNYLEAFFKQQRKKRDQISLESNNEIKQFFRRSLNALELDFAQFDIKKSINVILEQFQGCLQEKKGVISLKQWIILVQIILKYLGQQQCQQGKVVVMQRIHFMVCSSFCQLFHENKSIKWRIFNSYLDLMISSQDLLHYLSIQYTSTMSIIYKDLLMKGFSQNTNQLTKLLYIFNSTLKGNSSNVSNFIVDLCVSQKWLLLKLVDFAISEHNLQSMALVQMVLTLFLSLLQFTPSKRISDIFFHSKFTQFLQRFLSFTEQVQPIISLLYLRLIYRIMADNTQFLNLIRSFIDLRTLHLKFRLNQEVQLVYQIESLLQIME